MPEEIIWRWGPLSRRINPVTGYRLAWATVLTLCVVMTSLSLGKVILTPWQVLDILASAETGGVHFIVEQLRLPRTLMAWLVGAALAISGLILQSIVRNPLASPDLLGVTSGASAAAVFYLAFFSMTLGHTWLPLAAMAGAGLAAAAIYLLAWQEGASPLRLVLVGVGISALLAAVTTFLLVFSPLSTTLSAYVWLAGSVYGATWQETQTLSLWLLVQIPLLVFLARQVVVQQLDDSPAQGIGVRVQWLRAGLLFASVALAGTAVAWAGGIAFVGLIAPHIAKKLVLPGFAGQAMMSALVGGLLVLIADLIGRTLFLPADLPAGIFVAALGTPFFLYLLIKQRH
ncbi:FecCD family ABC transporter permease [Oceanospirillum beijerinckii]|uniref:FecCD family ABC transporter permease n=1 Tax=Oceanospirillum beijerinckii TaxID=64976 RepID=UPI000421C5EE|nr:iron ABC transporter permease [Oceanospirillum beijerinckii]